MGYEKAIGYLKRLWIFIWHDDSLASWITSIILAFVLVKFVIYPGLGLLFGTTHPIVAVVSGSMEHRLVDDNGRYTICGAGFSEKRKIDFDVYWETCGNFYKEYNISKDAFNSFKFSNGFNTGDVMIIFRAEPKDIKIGDVIVFKSYRPDPIIHRVIQVRNTEIGIRIKTKGDHNSNSGPDENSIDEESIVGRAVFRVPLLGYVKITFVKIISLIKGG